MASGQLLDSEVFRLDRMNRTSKQAELGTLLQAIIDALQGIAAKLDADGGVADTDFASLWTDGLDD